MYDFRKFLDEAAHVRPSARQLRMMDTEFYAFAHFGPNTFTDREWGLGSEDEACFNPVDLDCDQWVEAVKSAGMKGLVLTAKHHDGFCLWPSRYTEHSVKNSPIKRDVVKECAEACARGGIKFGVYLSPWDRNSKYYGSDEYNVYYRNQLTELLTEYGPLFHVWFDGACGEGPNGKKQTYEFESWWELIRKYQPDATIFNDHGPDIRWCGNEAGVARHSEWAVVPSELCYWAEVQTGPGPLAGESRFDFLNNSDADLGTLPNILYSKGLVFAPSEIDMSIRPGWFWHEREEPHSLERLFNTYLTSVGANATFILNVPPTNRGLVDERDVKRLKELGDLIKKEFSEDLTGGAAPVRLPYDSSTQARYEAELPVPSDIKYIELAEDISQGQRVESFTVTVTDGDGRVRDGFYGTAIGHKKIVRFEARNMKKINLHVTAARGEPLISKIKVY
ncbi:MAG: alpha-L-fucosidase [Clostridiales bacterium]|nr:alpha-L-fucosidase [Clostridiales bacterium]